MLRTQPGWTLSSLAWGDIWCSHCLGMIPASFHPTSPYLCLNLNDAPASPICIYCLQNEVRNKPDARRHGWWDEEAHIWHTCWMFAPGMNGITVVSWEHYMETFLNYGRMFQCADSQLWILSTGSVLEGCARHSRCHTQCSLGCLSCALLEPIE